MERWFRDLTEKRIRRDSFRSVDELVEVITDYIEHNNTQPKPFVWTASAQSILAKVARARKTLDNLTTA